MFDILEADIVIMQEAKIQRKDLTDEMVLIHGWDVYVSLPRDKKGYSGVAIYTRTSKCCPIRAEEGLTGTLCPPKSTTRIRDLPEDQQIGGYPREDQLLGIVDEATIDSEGRTLILEFPAFVLIGVYAPATRDETRTDYRLSFHAALDARVRNLVALGKQVVLAGDLNIIRSGIDTAGFLDQLRKEGVTFEDFLSTPSRRFLNQLLFEGQVFGDRDDGRDQPVLWDLTRFFHPTRPGMFTCWETKKNARPGNFGSRIDYILCSDGIKEWFEDSNIQEGLMGSDHCPVYAVLKDRVEQNDHSCHIADLMNPVGMFSDGQRLRDWCTKDMLPQSARLLDEFDRRRSIKDMFMRKPAAPKLDSTTDSNHSSTTVSKSAEIPAKKLPSSTPKSDVDPTSASFCKTPTTTPTTSAPTASKRSAPMTSPVRQNKKSKPTPVKDNSKAGPGQSSLKGFFKPMTPAPPCEESEQGDEEALPVALAKTMSISRSKIQRSQSSASPANYDTDTNSFADSNIPSDGSDINGFEMPVEESKVFDPIESKESWSKLLGKKKAVPLCEHEEPCISFVTKKSGINKGRSFYMCSRPIGPSGQKEKGSQWRCGTFIWHSDWKGM
ncbi:Endonuclease/exonuclease/phosphatase [Coniella lustricola]|uniref:DNA-(apurinic or apyrimidinic site) endonuclease 2 n=1 Tax=Coniella lustricola TaxID=2025994 RepID=A0A2T3ALR1_9PEZI|nr:Endonuclease/exonuclease/phosphatase [Coniella lustricola]